MIKMLSLVVMCALFAPHRESVSQAAAKDDKESVAERLAKTTAIMVAKLDRIDRESYSGIKGSHFFFTIEKFMRFDPDPVEQDVLQDAPGHPSYNQYNFQALLDRSRDPKKYPVLEFSVTYFDGTGGSGESGGKGVKDEKGEQRHAAFLKKLTTGNRYVIAASSKAFDHAQGTVLPDKWGSMHASHADRTLFEPHSDALVAKVETLLQKEKRPAPDKKAGLTPERQKELDEMVEKIIPSAKEAGGPVLKAAIPDKLQKELPQEELFYVTRKMMEKMSELMNETKSQDKENSQKR